MFEDNESGLENQMLALRFGVVAVVIALGLLMFAWSESGLPVYLLATMAFVVMVGFLFGTVGKQIDHALDTIKEKE